MLYILNTFYTLFNWDIQQTATIYLCNIYSFMSLECLRWPIAIGWRPSPSFVFVVLFVCLWFFVPLENFVTHIETSPLPVKVFKFWFTRPKSVGHGYVFSMAVGIFWEWFKLVPFFVRGRTVDSEGGFQFFKVNILAVKHLKINILA